VETRATEEAGVEERDPQQASKGAPIEAADDQRYRRIVEQLPVVVYTHDGSRPPARKPYAPCWSRHPTSS
jgi:hypothetical protein